jgi:hypothetical protein
VSPPMVATKLPKQSSTSLTSKKNGGVATSHILTPNGKVDTDGHHIENTMTTQHVHGAENARDCFKEMAVGIRMHLLPYFIGRVQQGVDERLNQYLMK